MFGWTRNEAPSPTTKFEVILLFPRPSSTLTGSSSSMPLVSKEKLTIWNFDNLDTHIFFWFSYSFTPYSFINVLLSSPKYSLKVLAWYHQRLLRHYRCTILINWRQNCLPLSLSLQHQTRSPHARHSPFLFRALPKVLTPCPKLFLRYCKQAILVTWIDIVSFGFSRPLPK